MSDNIVLLRADAHVHPHGASIQRAKECLEAYEWTYTVAAEHNIKTILDLGDVFHDRAYVDAYTHSEVYRISRRFKKDAGIETRFVIGNHDMYLRDSRDHSSILAFESLGAVYDKPCTMEVGGVPIDVFPYVETGVHGGLKEAFPDKRSSILLFHAAVEGAIMSSASGMRREGTSTMVGHDMHEIEVDGAINPDAMEGWTRAYGGHYHLPQIVSKSPCWTEYVGSILQHCRGEIGERKRVILFNLDTMEAIDVFNDISPVFLRVDGDEIIPADTEFSNTRVTLMTSDPLSSSIRKLRKEIEKSGAIEVRMETKKSQLINRDAQKVSVQGATSWLADGKAMVRRYAKLQSPEGLDRDRLVEAGYNIVDVAETGVSE